MRFSLGILLLLLTYLVALPTGTVLACGNGGKCQKTTANANNEQTTGLGESCVENLPCNDCPADSDGCGHCHCPDCGAAGTSLTGFYRHISIEVFPVHAWLYADRAANFYFKAPRTSAHLTALFQPPRV